MISIIIPVLNEVRHGYLQRIFDALEKQNGEFEVIVVDSGSEDQTLELCQRASQIIQTTPCNRATRMNRGAEAARGDILLFHHPRSVLPEGALDSIRNTLENAEIVGGGFTHSFDHSKLSLNMKYTSWHSNKVRGKRGIIYLDHCLFVKKNIFEDIGGFEDVDIFEDTLFPMEMRKRGKLLILPEKVKTSAARFLKRGVYKQAFLNQLLKLGFHCGVSPKKLNQWYEGKDPYNVSS
jgi:rSAM/selenodomain-associated transferase 2